MRFGISETLKAFVREAEGYKTKAYQDTGGVWTIGYGHTKGVKPTDRITRERAEQYLADDLGEALSQVNALDVCTTQGQSDALADFVFNLGMARLRTSTLLRYIRQGFPTEEIQGQFRRWVYCKGKKLEGLVKRREWEARRWAEA